MTLSDTELKWLAIVVEVAITCLIFGILFGYYIGIKTPPKRKIKKY